jgi:hypothetical protein
MAVLKAWHEVQGKAADEVPIVSDTVIGHDRKRLATALRDDLKAVGVTRSILFEEDAPNVEALRFHDLRSTFCTWARRAGKSDAWIGERTGHELSGDMISRYDRAPRPLATSTTSPSPTSPRPCLSLSRWWPGCPPGCPKRLRAGPKMRATRDRKTKQIR